MFLSGVRADIDEPLLTAVAAELAGPLHMTVDEADVDRLRRCRMLGFRTARREGNYVIPVRVASATLRGATLPVGYRLVSADRVREDRLRELDNALRQDVPGNDGWQWDVEGFREETFESPPFDPALYWIASEEGSGRDVGLVRVWDNADGPRLGLIAVLGAVRRRGLATGLLARAFEVLDARGESEVVTEIDERNLPSLQLLIGIGACRVGGCVELISGAQDCLSR